MLKIHGANKGSIFYSRSDIDDKTKYFLDKKKATL
jgi:hypothetical protein